MDAVTSVALGLIQGLTEFLPISSSGHLVLGQHLFGIKEPDLLFDAALHVATLFAVVIVFRHEVVKVLKEFLNALSRTLRTPSDCRLLFGTAAWKIFLGTLPAVFTGLTFQTEIEELFSSPKLVCLSLIITGTLLWLTRYAGARGTVRSHDTSKEIPSVTWQKALIVGIAQACALAPGISRSGATIAVALLSGCNREDAGKFSFLLLIPAATGAFVLQVLGASDVTASATPLLLGSSVAFLSGYGALLLLLMLVKKGNLHHFAWYCWALGFAGLLLM
ncbi:undecaprenyl-diphosphate phosphatase [Thermodesulforhabdus norvegica]|uniref:Undecaprenyl-diphosphatase n=1 Tax=Thermodesulforhabdus norvegica TaxID=39841 RepID=A0A1I4VZ95_9BACT|nr:undecaprenyl-diphosphate phosphatase [Thermodesulforhabdus norvegica]SFN06533.1 undecaprenyl-diphosphatase [Thermodesulforhabdus norvegica]